MSVAVWLIGSLVKLSRLESTYATLKADIEDVTRQALPEENNIVNPLAQLQQRLDAFRSDSALLTSFHPARLTPLEILRILSIHRPPAEKLTLDDLFVAADSVRVTGRCDSFGTLLEWQRMLQEIPGFEDVDIPSPNRDAETGKVDFTLSLSCGRTVQ